MSAAKGAGGFLTREQVEEIAAAATAGDSLRAMRLAKGDQALVGAHVTFLAAKRLGLVNGEATPEDFLDRISIPDYMHLQQRLSGNAPDPTQSSTAE